MECFTFLLKLCPPQAQPPKCISLFLILVQFHCHFLGVSCHFQNKRILTLISRPLFLPPPVGFLHSSQSYPINLNLISSLICLWRLNGFIYTQNKVQPRSPCLLTPHRIWTLWTSPSSTHSTSPLSCSGIKTCVSS